MTFLLLNAHSYLYREKLTDQTYSFLPQLFPYFPLKLKQENSVLIPTLYVVCFYLRHLYLSNQPIEGAPSFTLVNS